MTKKLIHHIKRELTLAKQQSEDLVRAKDNLVKIMNGEHVSIDDHKDKGADILASSPIHLDIPLIHPDQLVQDDASNVKSITSPHPILTRMETARPQSSLISPQFPDDVGEDYVFYSAAESDALTTLHNRVMTLEHLLKQERLARINAEANIDHFETEQSVPLSSSFSSDCTIRNDDHNQDDESLENVNSQLTRLQNNMSDLKMQVDAYRKRAETAEMERDQVRQTMGDMMEERRRTLTDEDRLFPHIDDTDDAPNNDRQRRDNNDNRPDSKGNRRSRDRGRTILASPSPSPSRSKTESQTEIQSNKDGNNDDIIATPITAIPGRQRENDTLRPGLSPSRAMPIPMPLDVLLRRAGVSFSSSHLSSTDSIITKQQARALQKVLAHEIGDVDDVDDIIDIDTNTKEESKEDITKEEKSNMSSMEKTIKLDDQQQNIVKWDNLSYHGIPHACALTTLLVGLAMMRWLGAPIIKEK